MGFLEADIARLSSELVMWRTELAREIPPLTTQLRGSFPEILCNLEPLTSHVRSREMIVSTQSAWSAYVDNGVRGPDPPPVVSYLARRLQVRGLAIAAIPHTAGTPNTRRGRYGSITFELFGPMPTDFVNYVRSVALVFNGRKWEFTLGGTSQPFEDHHPYAARQINQRFTFDMLARYSEALGVRPFDDDFYGREAVIVDRKLNVPIEALSLSLADAQRWLEIN